VQPTKAEGGRRQDAPAARHAVRTRIPLVHNPVAVGRMNVVGEVQLELVDAGQVPDEARPLPVREVQATVVHEGLEQRLARLDHPIHVQRVHDDGRLDHLARPAQIPPDQPDRGVGVHAHVHRAQGRVLRPTPDGDLRPLRHAPRAHVLPQREEQLVELRSDDPGPRHHVRERLATPEHLGLHAFDGGCVKRGQHQRLLWPHVPPARPPGDERAHHERDRAHEQQHSIGVPHQTLVRWSGVPLAHQSIWRRMNVGMSRSVRWCRLTGRDAGRVNGIGSAPAAIRLAGTVTVRLPKLARTTRVGAGGVSSSRSNPVAMTVTRTSPSMDGSWTAPKMISASSPAASWMMEAMVVTSSIARSSPPVMLIRTPAAPWIEMLSRSGLEMASWAACTARFSPRPNPVPISAGPRFAITVRTSAKSTFTSPVTLMRSLIPCVAWSRTSSAFFSASRKEVPFPTTESSRSFGT